MKSRSKMLAFMSAAVVMFTLTLTSAAVQDMKDKDMKDKSMSMQGMDMSNKNIVEVAMADPKFSMLVSLIQTAGLADTLSGPGPFTVFAPTNEAFAKIPADKLNALKNDPEKLKMVLLYHVLSMKVASSDARTMMAPTAEGSSASVKVKMKDGRASEVKVDKARVIQADIMASNGVIHVIDTVLMPKMDKKMDGK